MPSSQRPFFLSSFLAAFRPQQPASSLSAAAASSHSNKHHGHAHAHGPSTSPSGSRSLSTSPQAHASAASSSSPSSSVAAVAAAGASPQTTTPQQRPHHHHGGSALPSYSPRATAAGTTTHGAIPIPGAADGRRRGSDSSSEGFRDVLGGEKWYIGGRTAGGEERFFKLGVVRRPRSQDRLSLDQLSL